MRRREPATRRREIWLIPKTLHIRLTFPYTYHHHCRRHFLYLSTDHIRSLPISFPSSTEPQNRKPLSTDQPPPFCCISLLHISLASHLDTTPFAGRPTVASHTLLCTHTLTIPRYDTFIAPIFFSLFLDLYQLGYPSSAPSGLDMDSMSRPKMACWSLEDPWFLEEVGVILHTHTSARAQALLLDFFSFLLAYLTL